MFIFDADFEAGELDQGPIIYERFICRSMSAGPIADIALLKYVASSRGQTRRHYNEVDNERTPAIEIRISSDKHCASTMLRECFKGIGDFRPRCLFARRRP